jgi:hypothetical protein
VAARSVLVACGQSFEQCSLALQPVSASIIALGPPQWNTVALSPYAGN